MNERRVPLMPAQASIEIKKSRFIAHVAQVASPAEARQFIAGVRENYPDARHVCWAYIAGENGVTTQLSASDDGEPSGTAGKPMLNVLQHSGLSEVAVAVVRYFGGTKLGTGGLVRAYSDAVQTVLEGLQTSLKIPSRDFLCVIAYEQENELRHVLQQLDAKIHQAEYAAQISLTFSLAEKKQAEFAAQMGHKVLIQAL